MSTSHRSETPAAAASATKSDLPSAIMMDGQDNIPVTSSSNYEDETFSPIDQIDSIPATASPKKNQEETAADGPVNDNSQQSSPSVANKNITITDGASSQKGPITAVDMSDVHGSIDQTASQVRSSQASQAHPQ